MAALMVVIITELEREPASVFQGVLCLARIVVTVMLCYTLIEVTYLWLAQSTTIPTVCTGARKLGRMTLS